MIYEFSVVDPKVHVERFGDYFVKLDDQQSDLNGTGEYLEIRMDGYFVRNERQCLVFTCTALTDTAIDLHHSAISKYPEHELDLGLFEWEDGFQKVIFYVETDTDFNYYDDWALTIKVSRGGRRGIWKYTKASAKDL